MPSTSYSLLICKQTLGNRDRLMESVGRTDLFDGDRRLPGLLFVKDGEADRARGIDVGVEEGRVELAFGRVQGWTGRGRGKAYTSAALWGSLNMSDQFATSGGKGRHTIWKGHDYFILSAFPIGLR